MSERRSRWVLWIAFVIAIPVPFFLVETGSIPVIRLLMLDAVMLWLMLFEGSQGAITSLVVILSTQVVIAASVLMILAAVMARFTRRWSDGGRGLATAVVLAVLLVSSAFEIYHTPFRTRSLDASIFEVFE